MFLEGKTAEIVTNLLQDENADEQGLLRLIKKITSTAENKNANKTTSDPSLIKSAGIAAK